MSQHIMTLAIYFDRERTQLSGGQMSRWPNCGGYPDPVAARAELKRRFHFRRRFGRGRDEETFHREGSAVVITDPRYVTVIDFEEPSLFNQET